MSQEKGYGSPALAFTTSNRATGLVGQYWGGRELRNDRSRLLSNNIRLVRWWSGNYNIDERERSRATQLRGLKISLLMVMGSSSIGHIILVFCCMVDTVPRQSRGHPCLMPL